MSFKTDFIETFGEDKWNELQTIYHSEERGPENENAKVAFRLLEMFDFRCFDYGDNQGIDENNAKDLLIRNREEVLKMNMPPTSYMGLLCGVFNFLIDKDNKAEEAGKK